jgi:ribA/ribD-fused uncharacterized protein
MTHSITPRGPAADPKYPPSIDPSNPYGFTPQLLAAGRLPPKVTSRYVFFFGYEGSDPHVALQQWFPSPFTAPRNPYKHDNTSIQFPTTEHYMMYHKALLMGDDEVAEKILADAHPSAAKRLGRQVRNFDIDIWKHHADGVVEEANWLKFSQNDDLKKLLLDTGDRMLVEAR